MSIKKEQIEKIIMSNFNIEVIETRNCDSLDFHDIAIWQLVSAIREAYDMGKTDAKN